MQNHFTCRYKVVSQKRAVNSAELSEASLDDEAEDQSLTPCLCVYDVEKLDDNVDSVPASVSGPFEPATALCSC